MKNNQLTFILTGVFLLSAFGAALVGQIYNSAYHQLQGAAAQVEQLQKTQIFIKSVLSATAEYGKLNPDIMPLVQAATNANAHMPPTR